MANGDYAAFDMKADITLTFTRPDQQPRYLGIAALGDTQDDDAGPGVTVIAGWDPAGADPQSRETVLFLHAR